MKNFIPGNLRRYSIQDLFYEFSHKIFLKIEQYSYFIHFTGHFKKYFY